MDQRTKGLLYTAQACTPELIRTRTCRVPVKLLDDLRRESNAEANAEQAAALEQEPKKRRGK